MKQIASLILFNALLSFAMFAVAAIVIIRTIPAAKLLLDADLCRSNPSELRAKYGDPVREVRRILWLLESILLPIIAATIGTITGMIAKAHPVPIALLGILPLEAFFLRFSKFRMKEVLSWIRCVSFGNCTGRLLSAQHMVNPWFS